MIPLVSMATAAGAVSASRLPDPLHMRAGKVAHEAGASAAGPTGGSASTDPSIAASSGVRVDRSRQEFEAFVLQSMLGAMVPKETAKLFGTGSAGRMWTSLLVEKMATEIARGGRVRLITDETFARSAGKGGAPHPPTSSTSLGSTGPHQEPVFDGWETQVHIDAPFAGVHDGGAAANALAALDSWMTMPRSNEP